MKTEQEIKEFMVRNGLVINAKEKEVSDRAAYIVDNIRSKRLSIEREGD